MTFTPDNLSGRVTLLVVLPLGVPAGTGGMATDRLLVSLVETVGVLFGTAFLEAGTTRLPSAG